MPLPTILEERWNAAAERDTAAPAAEPPATTGAAADRFGLYADRPDLVYEPAHALDPDTLVADLVKAVKAEIRGRVPGFLAKVTPRGRAGVSVDTSEIQSALRSEFSSFFGTGGRTFDVKDGWGRWHSVTVAPTRLTRGQRWIDKGDDTKFNTKVDATHAANETAVAGENLTVGTGIMVGGQFGPGGGVSGEVALASTSESVDSNTALTDSRSVSSDRNSHFVESPVRFLVTAGDLGTVGPPASGHATDAGTRPVVATVAFHAMDDIARATPRDDRRTGRFNVPTLVENTMPVRILDARIGTDTTPVSWNEAAEHVLAELTASGVADPGTGGRKQVRSLLSEASVLGTLMPALESPAHSPLIVSRTGREAAGLEMTTGVTSIRTIADVDKSSFSWQPGIFRTARMQHRSNVGAGGSVVPIRWGFGTAWAQARLTAGFRRNTTTNAQQSSTTNRGTEFRNVENTLTEMKVNVRLDSAVRQNVLRHPNPHGVDPVELELTVLARLPKKTVDQLLTSTRRAPVVPPAAPPTVTTPKPAPPFVRRGGHAVPYGMSRFGGVQRNAETLVRRIGGGFLPRFRNFGVAGRMSFTGSAAERQRNQAELDRVVSVAALRQNYEALLNGGITAVLTRTGGFHDRHIVVHVTGEHPGDPVGSGTRAGVAVSNYHSAGREGGTATGGQWRAAGLVEGSYVARFGGPAGFGLEAGGGVEANKRWGRDGGVETSGEESVQHGGTDDSEGFDGPLRIKVAVYSYRTGVSRDRGSRVGFGRSVRGRAARVVSGLTAGFIRDDVPLRGQLVPRYRKYETRNVTVLYPGSSLPDSAFDRPVTVDSRERRDLARRTETDLSALRDFVDRNDAGTEVTVDDWQLVESLPGSASALEMVRTTVHDTQQYADRASRRRLGGLRGAEALTEGMPTWADITDKLNHDRQINNLGAMTESHWGIEPITTMEDGGRLDVALAGRIVNPRLVPVRGTITTEKASGGSTELWGSRMRERQIQVRARAGLSLRKPTRNSDRYGGGAVGQIAYQRLLTSKIKNAKDKVGGSIQKSSTNRKGQDRGYLVVADLRLTVAAEVTNRAQFPKSLMPRPMQPDGWTHHKTVQHSAVIRNGVYLRVTEAQAIKMGLLPGTDDGTRVPHGPRENKPVTDEVREARLTLPPGRSPGQGLQVFREVPSLVGPAVEALRRAVADPERRPLLEPVLNALTGKGLSDPMLNRTRMLQMLSRGGVKRSWGDLHDGGVSLIHADTGLVTQHLYDVRLEARQDPGAALDFHGFRADHDDVDVRTVGTRVESHETHKTHGGRLLIGGQGTAALNPQGKPATLGAGHDYVSQHQVDDASSVDSEEKQTRVSSARGVKARVGMRPVFEIKVYHRGQALPEGTVTFSETVTLDRWAGDLRTAAGVSAPAALTSPGAYRPTSSPGAEPGWQRRNGLLIPPSFSPEGLGPAKSMQTAVTRMLDGVPERLVKQGYPSSAQVRAGLTPDLLLPNTPSLLSQEMLDLPTVPAADLVMRKLLPKAGLLPMAARLAGVDSTVYRGRKADASTRTGTARTTQNSSSHAPRILAGDANMGGPSGPVQTTSTGPVIEQSMDRTIGRSAKAVASGDVKTTEPSALIEYVARPVLSALITGPGSGPRRHADPDEEVRVVVRTGLADARRVLGIDAGAPAEAKAAFEAIVSGEARLKEAADRFVEMSEAEAGIRYRYGGSVRPAERAAWEISVRQRDRAEAVWWRLVQEHWDRLDHFQSHYVALGTTTTFRPASPSAARASTAPPSGSPANSGPRRH